MNELKEEIQELSLKERRMLQATWRLCPKDTAPPFFTPVKHWTCELCGGLIRSLQRYHGCKLEKGPMAKAHTVCVEALVQEAEREELDF
jgi:hypothetical protein